MIDGQVRGIMHKAVLRFSKEDKVSPKSIAVVIHTKDEENLSPKYFYTVSGKPKTGTDGKVKDLDFNNDILGIGDFDIFMRKTLVANFLTKKFHLFQEAYNIPVKEQYVMIAPQSDEALDFDVTLMQGNKVFKKFNLEEIFSL